MNQAFNMDCMEAMREFPDNFFDLAVCDPPYGGGAKADASETFNGAVQGRFGGRFEKYLVGDSSQSLNVEREREREPNEGTPAR